MSVIVTGLNYQVADVAMLERLSFTEEDFSKALSAVLQCDHVNEAVILSTCNRVEIYANVSRFHPAAAELRDYLGEYHHVSPTEFGDQLYTYFDDAAISHLFRVASGLDSMVLGETEILGQVRDAFKWAQAAGSVKRTLSALFRRALEVGKRVRTETGISRNAASVSSAAVALAEKELGGLQGRKIVVLGAGEAGQAAARALANAGATDLTVINRSHDRARIVAEQFGAAFDGMEALGDAIRDADILVTCTRKDEVVLDRDFLAKIIVDRSDTPLLVLDIAVPRDVAPDANDIHGIRILDMDALKNFAEVGRRKRVVEARRGHQIVSFEVSRFLEDEMAARYRSLIADLRSVAERIREAEVARYSHGLADLKSDQLDVIESLTRSLINKLLHTPTVRMRELAATPEGASLAEALARLFDLPADQHADSTSDA